MQYQEVNLFNTAFICPFTEKRPVSLYVREDIIDAQKIELVCHETTEWKLVEYNDHAYYMAWIPLENRHTKVKNGKIKQLGFYVMTDTPSMFEVGHMHRNMEWLEHCWDKMFLMTTPVLQYVPASSMHTMNMHMDYFISNTYPLRKVLIVGHSVHTTWMEMLQNRAYTFGNGLSLYLTMMKSGRISLFDGKQHIERMFHDFGIELFQPVNDRWMELYYGHPIMHVCDNHYFYCAMGNPCVPYEIFEMFAPHDDDVIMNVAHGNTLVLSTVRSILLTNFRAEWWERLIGEAWYECPFDIQVGDEYAPNLASFFLSMVRSKGSWNWWMTHRHEYIESLNEMLTRYHSPIRVMENILQPVLHLYEHAQEYTPKLCYSRLRTLWKQLLARFDPNCEHVVNLIQRWSLRYTFIHTLKVSGYISQPGWEFQPPVAFMKDVVEIYGERCDLYRKYSLRIYTEYDRMIAHRFPALLNDGHVLRSNVDTIKVLQMAPKHSTYHTFYKTFVRARIDSRMMGIYHGFGMLENKISTVPEWKKLPGMHTIGFLLLEYIQQNPNLLYA